MDKKVFVCIAVDTTKDAEKIVVGQQCLLAVDKQNARDLFLLKNHHELEAISSNMEILVSPFC